MIITIISKAATAAGNQLKNQSFDFLPIDSTRVKLPLLDDQVIILIMTIMIMMTMVIEMNMMMIESSRVKLPVLIRQQSSDQLKKMIIIMNIMMTMMMKTATMTVIDDNHFKEGSDYINASWIPGFLSLTEFIMSQHPKVNE